MRRALSYILELAGIGALTIAAWRGISPEVGLAVAGTWAVLVGWWVDR